MKRLFIYFLKKLVIAYIVTYISNIFMWVFKYCIPFTVKFENYDLNDKLMITMF